MRRQTIRIEVHLSGTLIERIGELDIPALDDDEGWERLKWTLRQVVKGAARIRSDQEALRVARRTYK